MDKAIQTIKVTRQNVINILNNYSEDELNQIPEGYNNNLIWHLGHVIATQQLLCYGLSDVDLAVSRELVDKYRKGTKPESHVSSEEIELLKSLAISSLDAFSQDLNLGKFSDFRSYSTSYGVSLNSLDEAVKFIVAHDALHFGYVMSMRRHIS
jgi:hypothetical protein